MDIQSKESRDSIVIIRFLLLEYVIVVDRLNIVLHRYVFLIGGSMVKVDHLANCLQVAKDAGPKKVLVPMTSASDLGTVPPELMGTFNLIFYQTPEDAVFKALGVE